MPRRVPSLLPTTLLLGLLLHRLLTQDLTRRHEAERFSQEHGVMGRLTTAEKCLQSTVPATKSSHAFRLDTGHPEKVLGVGEIVGKLSKLRMQLGLYSGCQPHWHAL